MKREDIEKLIKDAGIAEDKVKGIVDSLMAENGKDIEAEKAKVTAETEKLNKANEQIKTLNEGIKKFDGVDVEKLKSTAKEWEDKYNKDINQLKFDNALNAALTGAKAKNAKAVKALLNIDELKLDGDKILGFDTQIEALKKDNDFLFDVVDNNNNQNTNPNNSSFIVNSGANHQTISNPDHDKMSDSDYYSQVAFKKEK